MIVYQQNIKPIRRIASIVFILVFDFLLIYFLKSKIFEKANIIFIIVGIVGTWIFFVKPFVISLELLITNETLIKSYRLFNLKIYSVRFPLEEITKIKILKDVKEKTSWGMNTLVIYDKTPKVLSFTHKGKLVTIGKSYKINEIEKVIKEIENQKKKINPT